MIRSARIFLCLANPAYRFRQLTFKIGPTFCDKLPKPSRFSQQLGLHKQFQQLQNHKIKQQKQSATTYQLFILGSVCVIGSFIAGALIIPQLRHRLFLYFDALKLWLSFGRGQGCLDCLGRVIDYQEMFYRDRVFSDALIAYIIERCMDFGVPGQQYGGRWGYEDAAERALMGNFNNQENQRNQYALYKKYLLRVGSPNDEMQRFLAQNADLETFYLLAYYQNKKYMKINQQAKVKIIEKLPKIKQQIREIEQKIVTIKEASKTSLLMDPYEFECQIKNKWIKYIQKYI